MRPGPVSLSLSLSVSVCLSVNGCSLYSNRPCSYRAPRYCRVRNYIVGSRRPALGVVLSLSGALLSFPNRSALKSNAPLWTTERPSALGMRRVGRHLRAAAEAARRWWWWHLWRCVEWWRSGYWQTVPVHLHTHSVAHRQLYSVLNMYTAGWTRFNVPLDTV